ncbi:MAG: endonuclease/exonuclease/phosphatase family protein [Opitutaceae bacterium]
MLKNLIITTLTTLVGSCSFILIFSITFSFFGKYHWILDLCSHFRLQYLICSLPLIVTLYILKRPKPAIALLLLSLANAALLIPHYITEPTPIQDGATFHSAVLLNVNTQLGSPRHVEAFILETNPDFIILEEIDDIWIQSIPDIVSAYPHQCIETRADNFGIGLFSKYPLSHSKIKYIGDAQLPSISATINFGSAKLNVIATHTLPPKNRTYSELRNDQLEQLATYAASKDSPTILLGDLNATPFNFHFKKLLKASKLSDSSTSHRLQPTWPSFFPALGIPIDHFLHTADIAIVDRFIGPKVGSDHLPLVVHFQTLKN